MIVVVLHDKSRIRVYFSVLSCSQCVNETISLNYRSLRYAFFDYNFNTFLFIKYCNSSFFELEKSSSFFVSVSVISFSSSVVELYRSIKEEFSENSFLCKSLSWGTLSCTTNFGVKAVDF